MCNSEDLELIGSLFAASSVFPCICTHAYALDPVGEGGFFTLSCSNEL